MTNTLLFNDAPNIANYCKRIHQNHFNSARELIRESKNNFF